MADSKSLHCNVITPERQVLECDATFVALPAFDGEIGFMNNRAPLLGKLGLGELRVTTDDGERRFFLDGGFVQMLDNQLTILTERAEEASDLDAAAIDRELTDALALSGADPTARDIAVRRAKARKRIAANR